MKNNQPLQLGRLVGLQVGRVQLHSMPESRRTDSEGAMWISGIYKSAASPARVTRNGIAGDEQADLENHGGPDNVILAYDAAHYPLWRERLQMPELSYGGFGENFTVEGFSDEDVCIGDIWEAGDLRLQVTQARQPCFKLARRMGTPDIVRMVMETSWGGWYLRVLHDGIAEVGMPIQLVQRFHPQWSVARAVQTMYGRRRDIGSARQLAALPELSTRWKNELVLLDQQSQQAQQQ